MAVCPVDTLHHDIDKYLGSLGVLDTWSTVAMYTVYSTYILTVHMCVCKHSSHLHTYILTAGHDRAGHDTQPRVTAPPTPISSAPAHSFASRPSQDGVTAPAWCCCRCCVCKYVMYVCIYVSNHVLHIHDDPSLAQRALAAALHSPASAPSPFTPDSKASRRRCRLRPPCRSRLDSNLKAPPRRANCQRLRVVCQ